ncbi:TPA: hypothetical protein M4K80_002978 [Salmonella enterica]|nr:hypothetical protein [Salmonella enterica]
MDILEASAKLERIKLLAKIAQVGEVSEKEQTIALTWIGKIAEEIRRDVGQRAIKVQCGHNI